MRPRRTLCGLILALLAVASQLAAGATVPEAIGQVAAPLSGFGIICHTGVPADRPPAHHHTPPDCQACLLCAALATPAPVVSGGPALPAPRTVPTTLAAPPPPSRAPPAINFLAARPRGPPILV
jgi:hypothetical protein